MHNCKYKKENYFSFDFRITKAYSLKDIHYYPRQMKYENKSVLKDIIHNNFLILVFLFSTYFHMFALVYHSFAPVCLDDLSEPIINFL